MAQIFDKKCANLDSGTEKDGRESDKGKSNIPIEVSLRIEI